MESGLFREPIARLANEQPVTGGGALRGHNAQYRRTDRQFQIGEEP